MTRLIVFFTILIGFVLTFTLYNFKGLPLSNDKFDFKKTEEAFKAHELSVKEALASKAEEGKTKEETAEEAVEVEYAPIIELSSPQLVAGNKAFNQCIACHGKGGEGKVSLNAPHIGGQYDWYIEKQLTDMKSKARINVPMDIILKGLKPEDIKNLAAYIALLPWNKEKYIAGQKQAEVGKK